MKDLKIKKINDIIQYKLKFKFFQILLNLSILIYQLDIPNYEKELYLNPGEFFNALFYKPGR